jgi:hypothetical protein
MKNWRIFIQYGKGTHAKLDSEFETTVHADLRWIEIVNGDMTGITRVELVDRTGKTVHTYFKG